MGLAARARRLVAARRVGELVAEGLVWTRPAAGVAEFAEGVAVVLDYRVVVYRAGDASEAEWVPRAAEGPDDHGFVLAWNGAVIGRVRPGDGGGGLLVFAWPPGLAHVDPDSPRAAELAAAEASGGADLAAIRATRSAEAERVAAELADVERRRTGQV